MDRKGGKILDLRPRWIASDFLNEAANKAEVEQQVSEYILFYNQNRFQKKLNGRSPVEYLSGDKNIVPLKVAKIAAFFCFIGTSSCPESRTRTCTDYSKGQLCSHAISLKVSLTNGIL
ncbi:IS3 family transposase [Paenibacillus glucanolyticus]|uniref:IS3 family transposase n=1 Tax=Paenibacillus glucanolyticus TaxID=59843 RepID=UPI0036B11C4D